MPGDAQELPPQDAANNEEPREKGDELDMVLKGADALEKIVKEHPEAANGAYANFMLGIHRTKAWHKVEEGWNKTPDNIKALMISRYAKYLPLGPIPIAMESIRFLVESGLLEAPKNTTPEKIGKETSTDTKIAAIIIAAITAIFAPETLPKIAQLIPKLMTIAKLRNDLNESSRAAISIDKLRQETAQKVAANNSEAA